MSEGEGGRYVLLDGQAVSLDMGESGGRDLNSSPPDYIRSAGGSAATAHLSV